MILTMQDRRGASGPARGTRFRAPSYDPKKGEAYRPGSNFEPDNAVKLLAICEALDISVAGFLNKMVELIQVDPTTKRPVGWPAQIALMEELKEAS